MNEPARKRNLMDISRAYQDLLFMADEAEGVLDDDLLEAFRQVEGEFSNKVDRALSIVETFKAKAKAEKDRAAKIAAHAKGLEGEAKRLSDWIHQNMIAADMGIVETPNYTAKIAKVAPSVQLEDVDFMAWAVSNEREDLITRKEAPAPVPNKKEVLAALKRGEKIRGAELIELRTRLVVK